MNYILEIDPLNIDKVIYKLSSFADIKITDVTRSLGVIHVNTKGLSIINEIKEVKNVKKEGLFPNLLFF